MKNIKSKKLQLKKTTIKRLESLHQVKGGTSAFGGSTEGLRRALSVDLPINECL